MLLSDAAVGKYLQENFILCWNSVRPAPKVTIDFGNGKTLERTIKGNTAFYLCRADGTVVDSLPGVYKPDDFLDELKLSVPLLDLSDKEVLQRHQMQLAIGSMDMNEAIGKGAVESPLVMALEPTTLPKLRVEGEIMDVSAEPLAFEDYEKKYLPGEGSLAERALEADSQSSLTVLRPAVHKWFGELARLPSLSQARKPIYKDILKVDLDDPYLGLKVDGLPGTP